MAQRASATSILDNFHPKAFKMLRPYEFGMDDMPLSFSMDRNCIADYNIRFVAFDIVSATKQVSMLPLQAHQSTSGQGYRGNFVEM
mmetsp:Transcript_60271/g.95727  ORF Transcript_60271/g.95727 Transcript_60271/m.95727 type:complete len:86 (-) Transcript_60271:282-539(-)